MGTVLGPDTLAAILRSHSLPSDADGPLFNDDLEGFLSWREANLKSQILKVTGWPSPNTIDTAVASTESDDHE